MRILVFLVLLGFSLSTKAQKHDNEWWIQKHNWDGFTHWTQMMTISPKYFGPNALPVPELREALTEQDWSFEIRPETHFAKGDLTLDLYTALIAPLGKRASFECFIVPIEYYNISDTNIRDERMMRTIESKGWAGGDFWVGTHIQLIRDHKKWPDLQLSSYFKSASGLRLHHARYTDAPGYSIYLSAGKYIAGDTSSASSWRWYANLGMYVWQQYETLHFQDDALYYGGGVKWKRDQLFMKVELAGYAGYLNQGDRPVIFRYQLGLSRNNMDYTLRFQKGFHDYPYQTFGISLKRHFQVKTI